MTLIKKNVLSINVYFIISTLISFIVLIPLLTVFLGFFGDTTEYFTIIKNTFLTEYIVNSLSILFGVLLLTFFYGFLAAYLVSFFDFPWVKFFKWGLILSFAVPAYIYAYSLTAFFENYGTAYTILFNIFGEGNYNKIIPKIDGLFGSILSLSFSLFGYVYILTRSSFSNQSQNLFDVGKNLGFSKIKIFTGIVIPSARPALVAGMSLVAMESLSDFGAVSFFSVSTLTTGIYDSWISFDDLTSANRLSSFLIIFIIIFFLIENFSRNKAKYHNQTRGGFRERKKIKLNGSKAFFAWSFCMLLFSLSFLFPTVQMLYWTITYPIYVQEINFIELTMNTFFLVSIASIILLIFSFLTNFSNRVVNNSFINYITFFSISGYAMPGIILAISLLTFFSWLSEFFGLNIKTLFIGSSFGLFLAYFVRFYSISFNAIKSNYIKINKSIDESAYLIGYSKLSTFFNIHLPFLRKSCFLIIILIAIEIMKELPITLILRPFNFETFATKAFSYASQDLLEAAALPSLCLIIFLTLFIIISSKYFLIDNKVD